MKARILVAAVGIPFLVAVLLAPSWVSMLLMAGMCALGAYELMRAVVGEKGKRLVPLTVSVAGLTPLCIYSEMRQAGLELTAMPQLPLTAMLALLCTCLLLVIAIRGYEADAALPFSAVTAAIFAGLVFPLMLSCMLRLRLLESGPILVFLPLVIAFGSDTFAYFFGLLLGKHKLVPRVSPKKTVEGAVGGLVGGVIGVLVLKGVVYWVAGLAAFTWGQVLLLGLLGSVVSQIGDLSFSVIKREFQVKDYGNLLPGHGGILDRFDSVTFVAPFVWFIFSFLR